MTGKLLISIFDSIPLWVMILPIAVCSIIALAVIIERLVFYSLIKVNYRLLLSGIIDALKSDNLDEAKIICESYGGRITKMIRNVLVKWNSAMNKEFIIMDESEKAIRSIEKRGGVISTIATTSPMLGLLGTVTGMMKSFSGLAKLGPSAQDLLAHGITEALITTALGLLVAIPSMMFYNYMVTKTEYFVKEVEIITNIFLDISANREKLT